MPEASRATLALAKHKVLIFMWERIYSASAFAG